jgi:hypothetical protein
LRSAPGALAAQCLPSGCSKVEGQTVCTTVVEAKNPQRKFVETTTTRGNLTNLSPEPKGVGTTEECNGPGRTEKCSPGKF